MSGHEFHDSTSKLYEEFAEKAKFNGIVKDRLGRTYHFVNGKRVKKSASSTGYRASIQSKSCDDVDSVIKFGPESIPHMNAAIESNPDFLHYGLRVMSDPLIKGVEIHKPNIGDILPNSYRWDDGDSTGEELEGTSSLYLGGQKAKVTTQHIKSMAPYLRLGKYAVLIGGNEAFSGEDPGESVIPNAEVIGVYKL